MNVVIRVDASIHIGSGHVMRCLVLADAFKGQGHRVQFVMRPQQGDMFDFVEQRGFKTTALPYEKAIEPKNSADYSAWLQVPVSKDVTDFFSLIHNVDVVVVDHYGITVDWEKKLIDRYGCTLLVIDDLVRTHHADLIVDQTLGRNAFEYNSSNVKEVLSGIQYALLNQRFSILHGQQTPLERTKVESNQNHKILLTMGGIDKPNATLKVLKALKNHLNKEIKVTVLLSPTAPNYEEVSAYCKNEFAWVTHLDFVEDMAAIMQCHSLAIGAPGSTSWERACVGLPSIVVPLADNQEEICQKLIEHELALSVRLGDIDEQLLATLQTLIVDYSAMRDRNLAVCDGKGVTRVMNRITQLMSTGG